MVTTPPSRIKLMLAGLLVSVRLVASVAVGSPAVLNPPGTLILAQFVSAPFPHPERAKGHRHNDNFFSAAEHYQDNTVALFVPGGFRAESNIDFVVHFHGWNNTATNALRKYLLLDQFAAGRRNAILIVPQGPHNAEDSFGGKLEDDGGFTRFMDEAMRILRERGVIGDAKIGRIILSAHSGGYEVASAIVARGGLTEHVTEIWLFDALYGNAERFALWFDHHSSRFIDLYTDHGGTRDESENLMTSLRENGVRFYAGEENAVTSTDLRANHLLFLHSELPHDEVLQGGRTFQLFLETSGLKETVHKAASSPSHE